MKIITFGSIKEQNLRALEADYLKRLKGAWPVVVTELKCESNPRKEAESLLSFLPNRAFLVALDEKGQQFTSSLFTQFLAERLNDSQKPLYFAIGGAFGWDETVRIRGDLILALSQLTFPHQLARLILIEQIYRAYTIIRGMPYHK